MSEAPQSQHVIDDFPGIDLSSGPAASPGQETYLQVNAQSDQPGKLNVRRGVVTVTSEASGTL